jgi:hypothetical protein
MQKPEVRWCRKLRTDAGNRRLVQKAGRKRKPDTKQRTDTESIMRYLQAQRAGIHSTENGGIYEPGM